MNLDPRLSIIDKRLSGIPIIIAVTGGKGGIGKSVVATTLSLTLAQAGQTVGLLDLDFTGPCDHIILGTNTGFPEEHFGIVPPLLHGIRFMSITHFAGERPAPLRGQDLSNALIELLSITQWGTLKILVIDMPPGIGDATLDAVRLMPQAQFLIVTTPSRVVQQTVARTLHFLSPLGITICGLVENMSTGNTEASQTLAREIPVPFLGSLPFDPTLENALGKPEALMQTAFARAIQHLHKSLNI
jgi:ATP-binding protein involved in chromosome partitioning